MTEWLFEIFSEEIPSRMQPKAQEQMKTLTATLLEAEGLNYTSIKSFVTPRRLIVAVEGLPLKTAEKNEERKGPRVDAPQVAIDGFLKSANVSREDCIVQETPKGSFLFVMEKKESQPTEKVLSQISKTLLETFSWPKSMKWADHPETWVRPIRGLLNIFEGKIISLSYTGVEASDKTWGHRFLAPGPFSVRDFEEYQKKLQEHFVILDWEERRKLIQEGIEKIAQEKNLSPADDASLLDEVTGLVEWPITLKGAIDPHFMTLPREVITTPMRVHQRYFPLLDQAGALSPFFGVITNVKATDQGKTIVIGNERVLRARLADAQFFWEQDQKQPLEHFNKALKTRLFHQSLGSLFDKVERLEKLSAVIAEKVKADVKVVQRAAHLSKADLASQMVGEFPELQGVMGRYYAENQGESVVVAQAIEEHYWSKASGGELPESLPSLVLAIADRIDTLVGFFAIGITPSGSKDPFALRRAGLSLIALVQARQFSLSMLDVIAAAYDIYPWKEMTPASLKTKEETLQTLWQFLLERFKFMLRDGQGSPYDHVDAVLAVAHENPTFSELALRAQALDTLMNTDDGQNLLVAYKRASNILRIEEDKDKTTYEGKLEVSLLREAGEKNLSQALQSHDQEIKDFVKSGDFGKAVQRLATLRPTVDAFFDQVIVNVEEKEVRTNRLNLLSCLRKTLHQVADFSKIEG